MQNTEFILLFLLLESYTTYTGCPDPEIGPTSGDISYDPTHISKGLAVLIYI